MKTLFLLLFISLLFNLTPAYTHEETKAEPSAKEILLKNIPIASEQHFIRTGYLQKAVMAIEWFYLSISVERYKYLVKIPVKDLLKLTDQHDSIPDIYGFHFTLSNYEPPDTEELNAFLIDMNYQGQLQSLNVHQFLSDFKNRYGHSNYGNVDSWYLLVMLQSDKSNHFNSVTNGLFYANHFYWKQWKADDRGPHMYMSRYKILPTHISYDLLGNSQP